MVMPRLTLRSTLLCVGLVAAWFASFQMDTLGRDLRSCFWFFTLATPVLWLLPYRNATSAFWTGFATAALACAAQSEWHVASGYIPQFRFAGEFAEIVAGEHRSERALFVCVYESSRLAATLTLCSFTGMLPVAILEARTRSTKVQLALPSPENAKQGNPQG
jgi:hypothetical protein